MRGRPISIAGWFGVACLLAGLGSGCRGSNYGACSDPMWDARNHPCINPCGSPCSPAMRGPRRGDTEVISRTPCPPPGQDAVLDEVTAALDTPPAADAPPPLDAPPVGEAPSPAAEPAPASAPEETVAE